MKKGKQGTSLADAFTREHHQIDAGIERYLQSDGQDVQPLFDALQALRRHIYLEEEIVFPHLPDGPLMMPLMVMYGEHGELWRQMDALTAAQGDLDRACRDILALLERHNSKEEPIIYPHLDADLTQEERTRVRELLTSGKLPADWTPRDASAPSQQLPW